MLLQKLFRKAIRLAVRRGPLANVLNFVKDCSQGEPGLLTDIRQAIMATSTAGASDGEYVSLNDAAGSEISADTSLTFTSEGQVFPVDTSSNRAVYLHNLPIGFRCSFIPTSATASLTGIHYFGEVNASGAADATALDDGDGIDDSETGAITVDDTTGFPSSGFILIDSEIIQYTSTTGTTFEGTITRGALGSTAAAHADDAVVTGIQSFTPTATTAHRRLNLFVYAAGKASIQEVG